MTVEKRLKLINILITVIVIGTIISIAGLLFYGFKSTGPKEVVYELKQVQGETIGNQSCNQQWALVPVEAK